MIADEYAMRLSLWSDIQDHLPRLYSEAAKGDCVVIELGVRAGNSTAAFLAAVDQFGGHVHSCDIHRPGVPWAQHPQWTFYEGDDLELVDDLPDAVDIVFIDTSHFYDQTCAELELYVPKVKPGGVVLLHDTELKFPEGRPWDDPPYPVRAAVDLYCAEHRLSCEFIEGCNGLGVIQIPEASDD